MKTSKKRLISFLLAVLMVLSVAPVTVLADDTPSGAVALVTNAKGQPVEGKWRVGEFEVDYTTKAEAETEAMKKIQQNGTGKWYIEGEEGTPYDTEELAKEHAVYRNGDGKYYLDAEFTTPVGGKETAEAAQAEAIVYQWTEGEGFDNKWYLDEEHTSTSYDDDTSAKAAVPTYQNGDGKWYTDAEYKTEGKAEKADAIDALPEGTVKQNGDGKWYLKSDSEKKNPYDTAEAIMADPESEVYIHQPGYLGDGYFSDLQKAFDACTVYTNNATAKESPAFTVTLKDDCRFVGNDGFKVAKGQNIILDLNGKMLSNYVTESKASQVIQNYGVLTIKDSTDTKKNGTGSGIIINYADPNNVEIGEWYKNPRNNYVTDCITSYGSAVTNIESGKIEDTAMGTICFCIDNQSGELNISGGYMTRYAGSAVRAYQNATTNISGGILEATNGGAAFYQQFGGNNKITANITGGTFNGDIKEYYSSFTGTATANISGGTFNGIVEHWGIVTTITGGTFNDRVDLRADDGNSITGGTFNGSVTTDGESIITGGTFNNITNGARYDVYVSAADQKCHIYKSVLEKGFPDDPSITTVSDLVNNGYDVTYIDYKTPDKVTSSYATDWPDYPEDTWFFYYSVEKDGKSYIVYDLYSYNGNTAYAYWDVAKDINKYKTPLVYTQSEELVLCDVNNENGNGWQSLQAWKDNGYVATRLSVGEYTVYACVDEKSAKYPDQIATGYFAYDNENGTYDVVKAAAQVTVNEYWDYTYTKDDHESTYYDKYDGYFIDNLGYYVKIAEAVAAEPALRAANAQNEGNGKTSTYTSYTLRIYGANNYLVRLMDNSHETFTLPAGVTFMIPKGEDGNNLYAYSGKVLAPEGYAVITKEETDGTYYTVIKEGQETAFEYTEDKVDMGGEQGEVFVPAINVSGKKDGASEGDPAVDIAEDELKKAAVEAAEKITENKAVTEFKDVGINEALKNESEAKDKEQKVDVKVDAVVVTKETSFVMALTGVGEESGHTTDTTSYQQSFDVKPMVKAEAAPAEDAADKNQYKQDASGEWWKIIPNEDIEGEITFRLPIESAIAKDTVAVYHKADATATGKGDFLGFFPIKSETKDDKTFKFVELKASEFSVYTYEVMTQVSQNSVFAIVNDDGSYTGYADLPTLADAIGETTDKNVILLKNFEEEEINFLNKQFTLDLDGHTLKGKSVNSDKVKLINSDTENYALLQAIGTYANDVKDLCSDGYDAKPSTEGGELNNEVYKPGNGDYQVVVEVTTGTDRDESNGEVDVFAGDTVTVTVSILGARYAAADVTLTYDKNNFTVKSAPKSNWTRDNDAGTFRFYNAKTGGGYYEPGKMTNGTFTFTVKEGDAEVIKDMFTVSTSDTYVASAWAAGWASDPATKLVYSEKEEENQLFDDFANIRLKQMNASVTPNNGLVYKEIGQKLLADGYTASNALTGAVIDDATISYAILPRDVAEGKVQMTDEGGNKLFYDKDGYLVTEDTGTPAYKPAEAPAAEDYTNIQPTVTDAGDYTIFWKISRKGYIPVSGKENVSIAPLNVTLNWTMPKDNATEGTPVTIKKTDMDANDGAGEQDGKGDKITADYWGSYSESGFGFSTTPVALDTDIATTIAGTKNIVASVNALNKDRIATVTMTGKPDVAAENVMKVVGTYEFTADLGSNYKISNPTVTVLVDGGKILGYDLSATTEGASVYYDGNEHTATVMTPGDNATSDVTVKYCYSKDNGETFTEWDDDIPVLSDSNPFPYIIKMQLSKDSFYTQEKTFNFSIKPVQYYTEKTDYITGWDLVLCYTDEDVPSFNYDGKMMYDVTSFGYKLGDVWNAAGTEITTAGQSYAHVYAYLVEGNAETSKVLPSNVNLVTTAGASYVIDLSGKGRYDANKSNTIDINDLVAVQAVYNVNKASLTGVGATGDMAKLSEQARMAIVLRADCSGNKIVDTYDCSLIKTNTGK